jgi:glycosyltransferase involved in cell wall biosynthesis
MIANIVHISLNTCGGSERLAITVMQALSKIGIDFDLTTFERPNMFKIDTAYGKSVASVIQRIGKVNVLRSLEKVDIKKHYDLTINTHGDMLPYFACDFSKNNSITYCHFPLAKYLINSKDPEYTRFLNSAVLSTMTNTDYSSRKRFQSAQTAYIHMLRNSTVLSNSEFSCKVIQKAFGIDSILLSPPVDVDFFRNTALLPSLSNNRKDVILVVARFHPSKKIENAIRLAKLLKQYQIGNCMKIVGNLPPSRYGYYSYLKQMVQDYNLTDYVTFEINVSFSKLLALMQDSKIYFHPLPGEPFGISTVEAMSAGLIPIVPDIGGHTEFVPLKYQFHTFGEGVEAIASALNAPNSERILISDSVRKYSIQNFIQRFQQIVNSLPTTKIKI